MIISLFRTLLLYALVVISLRVMGKRQIGELQPSELVVTIMISELASIPMQNSAIPILHGIVPILTLVVAEICLSFLSLKNRKFRKLINGSPSVIIENGKIQQQELLRLHYSIDDLLEELRILGYCNPADVQFAILETNGKISVFPIDGKKPVTMEALNIKAQPESVTYAVVLDGDFDKDRMNKMNVDEPWIMDTLKKYNITNIKDVFLLCVDSEKNVSLQIKTKGGGKV